MHKLPLFTFFQDSLPYGLKCSLATLSHDAVDGAVFRVSTSRVAAGDFSQIQAVMDACTRPDQMLRISMPASDLSVGMSYPFRTVKMQVTCLGRAAETMLVPVITEPAFQDWQVGNWNGLAGWIQEHGWYDRLHSISLPVTSKAFYDSEQFLPAPDGCKDALGFWAEHGVTPAAYEDALATIAGRVAALVPGKMATMTILNPYRAAISDVADSGVSYLRTVDKLIASVRAAGGRFVAIDVCVSPTTPRAIIQQAAAKAGAFAGQIVTMREPTQAAVQAALANVEAAPFALWEEMHPNELGMVA